MIVYFYHDNQQKLFKQNFMSQNSVKKQQHTKKFINNLDLLVGHDDKYLYTKITKQTIDRHIQKFPVVNEQGQPFSIFTSIQKFQIFSPGIYLMFKLIKHMIIMFAIISIFSLIQTLFLLKSPFYKGYQKFVRINMLRLTIASLEPEDYNVYIGFDILITFIVVFFLIFWSENLRKYARICNQNNNLPSYLTVQIENVDQTFSQASLKDYLIEKQGVIPHQIYTGRNYGRFLNHYKKMTQTAIQLRILKELYLFEQQQKQKIEMAPAIIKSFLKLKNQYCSIKSQKFNQKKYRPKQVFIVLQNYYDRNKILNKSKSFLSCLKKQKPENKTQHYEFKPCQVQPEAIAWENIGIGFLNYTSRAFLVFIVLSIVTILGIIVIFMLEVLQTAAIGDAYHFSQENMKVKSYYSLQAQKKQCVAGSTQSLQCKIQTSYSKLVGLILLTPFAVFVCKKAIMTLLSHFVHFRRHPSQVSRIKSQVITLSIFYFIVVGALHLFLYLKVNNNGISLYQMLHPIIVKMFNITNFSPASIHLYSDYSLDWYKQSTFFVIIIGSVSFNISNGVKFLINLISYKLQVRKAKKQKTLYGVKKALKGIDLHMEHIYASMIAIVYFALLYNCPIPLSSCFALVNLTFLFFLMKWTLIKYGPRPMRMGHSIARTATNLLFIGVIIHCLMTPIFLGAEGIARNNSHFSYQKDSHSTQNQRQGIMTVAQRYQKIGPVYLFIACFVFLYVILRKPFNIYVLPYIKQKVLKNQQQCQMQKQHFGLYPSYSMHNSAKYSQVLKNIYLLNKTEAKRSTCPVPKTLKHFSNSDINQCNNYFAFDEILQINNRYLDQQKYKKMHDELLEIEKIALRSSVDNSTIVDQDKGTDDRICANYLPNDQIIENIDDIQGQGQGSP